MKYFGHDTNARRDPRIRRLIQKYGAAGYGIYFAVNEMIAEKIFAPTKLDCVLEEDLDLVSVDLNETIERIREILDFCVSIGLFSMNGQKYQNTKILKRKDEYTDKRLRTLSRQSPDGVPTMSRINKAKQNKSNQNKSVSKEPLKPQGFAGSGLSEDEFKKQYPDIYKKIKGQKPEDLDL